MLNNEKIFSYSHNVLEIGFGLCPSMFLKHYTVITVYTKNKYLVTIYRFPVLYLYYNSKHSLSPVELLHS